MGLQRGFNPPSPCGEGRLGGAFCFRGVDVSIHPPRVGRDFVFRMNNEQDRKFQSTLPVWGGTPASVTLAQYATVSIHPPRVGRDWGRDRGGRQERVSIHPPRVGRDSSSRSYNSSSRVSIHPPRVGRDCQLPVSPGIFLSFNPPSPCGEGRARWVSLRYVSRFNPPSPCGEGLSRTVNTFSCSECFNPPSPCGEGRRLSTASRICLTFQSTLPVWGGTDFFHAGRSPWFVSIHPPRVGRDTCLTKHLPKRERFNPPSPCGEGPSLCVFAILDCSFQSTLPVWGGTSAWYLVIGIASGFNPPSPCGEGHAAESGHKPTAKFQSTLPVWGGTAPS